MLKIRDTIYYHIQEENNECDNKAYYGLKKQGALLYNLEIWKSVDLSWSVIYVFHFP